MDYFYKTKNIKISVGRFLLTLFLVLFSVYFYGFLLSFFTKKTSHYKIFGVLCSFVMAFFTLLFCLRKIHKQKIRPIFTSHKKIQWKFFFNAFFIYSVFFLLQFLLRYFLQPKFYIWNFNSSDIFRFLLPVLFLMPFQTFFEEVFFRGYLLRFIYWSGCNVFTSILMSSILFGFLHFANPEVEKIGLWALSYYVLWGVFFAVLTVKSGGLEWALGVHTAHNMLFTILITSDWDVLQTPSFFKFTGPPNLLLELGISLFFQIFLLFYLSKKYKWRILNAIMP